MSLVQLGDQAGVSASFLSQLERGLCSASFGTLRNITNALGVALSDLIDDSPVNRERVVRAADRPLIIDGPARKYLLSLPPLDSIEIFLGTFEPGASTGPDAYSHGDSQEFLFVSRGHVVVQIDDEEYALAEGDVVEYRSSQLHRTLNPGEEPAEALWIVSPVTVSADELHGAVTHK